MVLPGCGSVAEGLPSMHKALASIPSTAKKSKIKKKKTVDHR
jgi:hypothetical protein